MDLDTTFELLFGLIATILALLALWFTYKHKDGKHFELWDI